MGAGKSSLSCLLENDFTVFSIDDYRDAYKGDEHRAREALLRDVSRCKNNIIYETTTANAIHGKVMKILADRRFDISKVMLNVSKEEAKARWKAKRYNPTNNDWDSSFDYIAEKLKKEWADLFFYADQISELEIAKQIMASAC